VRRALDWLATGPLIDGRPVAPRFLVGAGFAGALRPGLGVGAVVVAAEVADTRGQRWQPGWPVDLHGLPAGRLLAVRKIVGSVVEKRRLGVSFQALAADMESAALARWATDRGTPFGCVRAVSDDAATPVSPRLLRVLIAGRVRPMRLAVELVRSPGLLRHLYRLARQTRLAADRLASALARLFGWPEPNASAAAIVTAQRLTLATGEEALRRSAPPAPSTADPAR
jgi:adenosylhomocysteine nucleosidase